MSEGEKVDKNGEPMYRVGNGPSIAGYGVIGNRGDNTGKPLYATQNDVELMTDTLKRLGMRPVVEKHYSKMTGEDVANCLHQLQAANLSRCPCFVFYYSGHGKDCGIHLDDGGTYPFIAIVECIMSLPDLKGRPKVFLFDCCRVYDGNVHVDDCKDHHVVESYTDCIIAYSCSKGGEAYISNVPYATNHSVFTKYLCLTLSSRHRQWPLVSILTQSSRLTQTTMNGFFSQTPQVIMKLQKQLYFCFDHFVEKGSALCFLEHGMSSDVCRDGPPVRRRQFKTKQDVTSNLGSLGQWLKVFICYAPSTTNDGTEKLELRVYTFARHLITYGFDVKVDLLESFTVGFDWVSWTDHEMSQADWIIVVCSRSSFELLHHPSGPKDISISLPSVKPTTRLDTIVSGVSKRIRFSGKILYNRLVNDNSLKIIPVILREEDNYLEYVLPALRDPKNILRIWEDRPFDYDNQGGQFEAMVCRMAGINRASIDQTASENAKQFVQLPSMLPRGNTSYLPEMQQVAQETAHGSYGISTHRHVGGTRQSPSPQYYHQNGSSQHTAHHPSLFTEYITNQCYHPNTAQAPNYYPPSASYEHPQYHSVSSSHTGNYTAQQYYPPQQPHQYAPCPAPRPVQLSDIMYSGSHASPAPLDVNSAGNRVTGSLPQHKIPVDSRILWDLSQDIKEWKFLGRFLDLDENALEEINQYTQPNKMRDKALKVLKEWVGSAPEPTWQALGAVLMESENVLLYEKLCELLKMNKV